MIYIDKDEMIYFYHSLVSKMLNANTEKFKINATININCDEISVYLTIFERKGHCCKSFSFYNFIPMEKALLTVGSIMGALELEDFDYILRIPS